MFQIAGLNRREPLFPCVHVPHEGGPGVADAAVLAPLSAGAQLVAGCDDAAARLVHLAALLVIEHVDAKVLQGVRRFTTLI